LVHPAEVGCSRKLVGALGKVLVSTVNPSNVSKYGDVGVTVTWPSAPDIHRREAKPNMSKRVNVNLIM
jgi:hypothetical protein